MGLQNLACTHCRLRKIKCDRTRPVCENCQRDDTDCKYSNPPTRVNHMKLLYQSVEALDGRLADFEGQIQLLTSMLKSGQAHAQPSSVFAAAAGESVASPPKKPGRPVPSRDRYILRNPSLDCNLYYGPASLIASCKSLSHDLQDLQQQGSPDTIDGDEVDGILAAMCSEVRVDGLPDSSPGQDAIQLPPRRVLGMVLDQFVSQSSHDYTLDVFVSDSLEQGVAAAYSQSQAPDTVAWAVCFNVLILLSLGAEPRQGRNMDLFLRPYVDTLQAAVGRLQALMVPKLVYVQALALLSLAAQQYSTPQVSDNVFAQTCVLAKTMGLHQSGMASEHLPAHEAVERRRVFRSLYIRDKALAISRGSPCWLPSVECSLSTCSSSNTSPANEDAALSTRLELADLQFECYRHLHSNQSQNDMDGERHGDELHSLHERLNRFARQRGLPASTPPTTLEEHDLNLSFLATRLYLLSSRPQPSRTEREQILHDAQLSCLLLLPLRHADHTAFLNMFDAAVASSTCNKPPLMTPDNTSDAGAAEEQLSCSLYRLALAFPATSLVHLTRHVVFGASRSSMDLELLRALYALLMNPEASINASTHVFVIAQTLEKLLRVTDVYHRPGTESSACSASGLNDAASLDLTLGSSQREGYDTKSQDSLFAPPRQSASASLYYSTPPLTDGLSLDGGPCMPDVDSQWPTMGTMDLGGHGNIRQKRRRNMTGTHAGSKMELDGLGMDLEQWDAGLWSQMSSMKTFVDQ